MEYAGWIGIGVTRNTSARERSYIVAGYKSWNRRTFDAVISKYPGRWYLVASPQELTLDWLQEVNPTYIFFLHWSWKVPPEIVNKYTCVNFHMTDLPYGRGGSPLQNLILRGHHQTKLTALRMTEEMDAGPIYTKEDLSLEGAAKEIYMRASDLSARMIQRIIEEEITPMPQQSQPTVFKRRRPHESEIPACSDLRQVYDFIRMLDAEGYPRAFLAHSGFRYEFSQADLQDGRLLAAVTIKPLEEKTP